MTQLLVGTKKGLFARACTRRGDITEVPMCTSVIRTAGVAATGID